MKVVPRNVRLLSFELGNNSVAAEGPFDDDLRGIELITLPVFA